MNRGWILIGSALAACATAPVRAADGALWEAGVGAAVLRLPQYRGADRSSILRMPVPYVIYRGPILRADEKGARARLLRSDGSEVDLSAALSPPVDSDANPVRAGMPSLSAIAELGPDAWMRLGGTAHTSRWSLHLPVRAAFTLQHGMRQVGWTVSPFLQGDLEASGWRLGGRAGPLWASGAYNDYIYGVAPQYTSADRPAYAAHGGMLGWRALASVSRRFDRMWIGAYASADTLAGSAVRASPLVRRETGFSVGLGVAWVFAVSERRASVDE